MQFHNPKVIRFCFCSIIFHSKKKCKSYQSKFIVILKLLHTLLQFLCTTITKMIVTKTRFLCCHLSDYFNFQLSLFIKFIVLYIYFIHKDHEIIRNGPANKNGRDVSITTITLQYYSYQCWIEPSLLVRSSGFFDGSSGFVVRFWQMNLGLEGYEVRFFCIWACV